MPKSGLRLRRLPGGPPGVRGLDLPQLQEHRERKRRRTPAGLALVRSLEHARRAVRRAGVPASLRLLRHRRRSRPGEETKVTQAEWVLQCRIRQWLWKTFGPKTDWKGFPMPRPEGKP